VANTEIDFDAPAILRKWPSLNNERIPNAWGGVPYLIFEGTLDECIKQFMSKSVSQHLYEIHTKPQVGGRAENIGSKRAFRLLTHFGHALHHSQTHLNRLSFAGRG
jgi:hypothetical protein